MTIKSDSPEAFFWVRHARRAQEPIVLLGNRADAVVELLNDQFINALANPPADTPRRVGMIGVTDPLTQQGDAARQRAFLKSQYDRLTIGGKLVFSVPLPNLSAIAAATHPDGVTRGPLEIATDNTGVRWYEWETTTCDPIAQKLSHHTITERVEIDGLSLDRRHTYRDTYYAFPTEIRHLLDSLGFYIEAVYGGWNDEPLTADAPIHLWVARKAVL